MKIEEEIKQSKFSNPFEKALVNIFFTANHFYGLNIKRLKKHGISPEQFNVLRILRGSHPLKMRLSDIASRMLDRNSNATRLVEKLRQKGLVTRDLCSSDRRQVDIAITEKGLEILAVIDGESKLWFEAHQTLNPAEATLLSDLLDKMRG